MIYKNRGGIVCHHFSPTIAVQGASFNEKNKLLLNFVIAWLGWGIPMGLLCSVMFMSLLKGLILGLMGGVFFAGVMTIFTQILFKRKDKLRERYGLKGEVLYDGAANHMVGKNAIGGWIFLMADRFCFASHAINVVVGVWSIPYSEIADVTKGKMIRSIAIHSKNGEVDEFVVNNCNEWITILKDKISAVTGA